jgi:hypothetical protein
MPRLIHYHLLSQQLTIEEEVFAKSIADVGVSFFGIDSNAIDSGSPQALVRAVMNGDTTAVTELVSTQLTSSFRSAML